MDFEVDRADLPRTRTVEGPPAPLAEGEARVRVDAFALTTNNITYAVFGDMLQYWQFFPGAPADAGEETQWGRIPVWGFGEVTETRSPDVAAGERLYGYFPMSSEVVLRPGRADAASISDTAPHRAGLAGAYNRYVRCAADPVYRPEREDQQMLLFPLFYTAFLIDDLIADREDFGADQVVLSSASSKTAIGVAFLAHRRGLPTVGLTSAGNAAFVESLGVYDTVLTYDALDALPELRTAYVDIAGNRDIVHAVHTRLGERIGHSMIVGGAHHDHETQVAPDAPLPGPAPEFFFAPAQVAKRTEDWGREGIAERVGEAWAAFSAWTDGWLRVSHARGADGVGAVYQDLLAGRIDPRAGHIATLIDTPED